jgi:uracil-DNA glycosylase family 4
LPSSLDKLNKTIVQCRKCPRLVEHRERVAHDKVPRFEDWNYWGRPLTGFGRRNAELLILGLAPAAHGGNRTGRMFTGDSSADFLMQALHRAGFANKPYSRNLADGLRLRNAYITAVVRCAPPANKPTPTEVQNCNPYLVTELSLLPKVRVVLTLGRLAFETYLRMLGQAGIETRPYKFGHGLYYRVPGPRPFLVASYHPSRQNTQTGKLTVAMLDRVMQTVGKLLRRK